MSLLQSPIDCLIKTVRQEGIAKGLYKGNSAMLLREIPGNFAWYGVYEGTCKALIPPGGTKKDLGTGVHLFGGALSGVTCVHTSCSPSQFQLNQHAQCSRSNTVRTPRYWTVFYPADTIKSYIQTDPRFTSSSIYQVGAGIYKEHGFSGLYRGGVRNPQLQPIIHS